MAIINNVNEVLHKIRVKLYPNYLPGTEGEYVARTNTEAVLDIEAVCAALKNRGGYTGSYEVLVECVKQYFDEMAYQLCDGFGVSTGYFSLHPNVGGMFPRATDTHDGKKHPVTFRFRTREPLRALAGLIVVEIEGLADVSGYIDEFIDVDADAVNETVTPGGQFSISGHKIKVDGDKPEVGVYFVTNNGTQKTKVTARFAENTASKVIGKAPYPMPAGPCKVQIVTQHTSGGSRLKEPRTIEFQTELTIVSPPKPE